MPNNKPSERVRKEQALRKHIVPFFGNSRLDQITASRIEAFKASRIKLGLKPSTVNRQLAVLNRLLRSAEDWGYIERCPRVRRLPTQRPTFDWLRPHEAQRLLEVTRGCSLRWHAFILVALRAGLRKGEIMGLHWSEVDFEGGLLTVKYNAWRGRLGTPKSGRSRVVPMTADLSATLRNWRGCSRGSLIFPAARGGIMSDPLSPNRALDSALDAAGLRRIRFHDLRHSFASHLVRYGVSLSEVQALMGHCSVTVTERYAHIADERLAAAVRVLDRDDESSD